MTVTHNPHHNGFASNYHTLCMATWAAIMITQLSKPLQAEHYLLQGSASPPTMSPVSLQRPLSSLWCRPGPERT